jgi:hypothetical protein
MKQVGTHLVVDAWQAPEDLLNDPEGIRRALIDAISAGEATLIDLCVHQFSPTESRQRQRWQSLISPYILGRSMDISLPIYSFAVVASLSRR